MRTACLAALLVACAGAKPPPAGTCAAGPEPAKTASEVLRVDGPTAKALVAQGARLIDVRAPDFYGREHIQGAINIPVAQVAERAEADIGPAATPVILYCRTGKGSAAAARTLIALGYTRVYDLGSYLNWGEGAPSPTPLPPAN
jgi:rhodanese-related sulfurtransferase